MSGPIRTHAEGVKQRPCSKSTRDGGRGHKLQQATPSNAQAGAVLRKKSWRTGGASNHQSVALAPQASRDEESLQSKRRASPCQPEFQTGRAKRTVFVARTAPPTPSPSFVPLTAFADSRTGKRETGFPRRGLRRGGGVALGRSAGVCSLAGMPGTDRQSPSPARDR